MKVVGIVGSPRRRANSTALLEQVLAGAEAEGAQSQIIRPSSLDIAPCLACDGCLQNGRCTVEDDFQGVYDAILACDVLVLATPVYFGAVSAQVKALIDRCESFWKMTFVLGAPVPPGPAGNPRQGVLIATAGKDREIMFVGPKITFGFLMRSLQGQVSAELLYGGLDEPESIRGNSSAMTEAYEVGRRLADGQEPDEELAALEPSGPVLQG